MTLLCELELSLCMMKLKMQRGAPSIGLAQGLAWWAPKKHKREHWYCYLWVPIALRKISGRGRRGMQGQYWWFLIMSLLKP